MTTSTVSEPRARSHSPELSLQNPSEEPKPPPQQRRLFIIVDEEGLAAHEASKSGKITRLRQELRLKNVEIANLEQLLAIERKERDSRVKELDRQLTALIQPVRQLEETAHRLNWENCRLREVLNDRRRRRRQRQRQRR